MNPYVAGFRHAFVHQLRQRGALVFTTAFYAIILFCWGAIWWAATAGGERTISGYGYENMVWYIAATEAAVVVVSARRIEHIGDDIANGNLETEMLRPISIVGFRLARETGESYARLLFVAPTGLLLSVLYTGNVPNPSGLLLFVPAALLAVACNVASVYAFAALAFWIRDARAAWFLFQKFIFLPGGMLLPLQMLPHVVMVAAWCMPFWAMAYAPGRLASGSVEPLLLAGQLAWLGVLVAIATQLYAVGQRRIQQGIV
jgi:ABC-2 type transport system permease protein